MKKIINSILVSSVLFTVSLTAENIQELNKKDQVKVLNNLNKIHKVKNKVHKKYMSYKKYNSLLIKKNKIILKERQTIRNLKQKIKNLRRKLNETNKYGCVEDKELRKMIDDELKVDMLSTENINNILKPQNETGNMNNQNIIEKTPNQEDIKDLPLAQTFPIDSDVPSVNTNTNKIKKQISNVFVPKKINNKIITKQKNNDNSTKMENSIVDDISF